MKEAGGSSYGSDDNESTMDDIQTPTWKHAERRSRVAGYPPIYRGILIYSGIKVMDVMNIVAISTSEVEWTAMVQGVCHAIFSREILGVMGFPEKRIPRFCDNLGTIQAAPQVGFGGSDSNAHASTWNED